MICRTALTLSLLLPSAVLGQQIRYPDSPRLDVTYERHGTTISDPYRWLEELDSEATREWIKAQNALAVAWLEDAPRRQWMRERLEALWHYDKYSTPRITGDRLFYTRKSGLQDQGVLYWQEDAANAEPRALLDPNKLSDDGTVALSGWSVSEDGRFLAYGLSTAGSDWQTWQVREIDTGKDLPDTLEWIKFSGAEWSLDSKGFYYSRYARPEKGRELEAANYFQKLYYHRLGTPQADDVLIYERRDEKEWGFGSIVTEDGAYLIIPVWKGATDDNALFYRKLTPGESDIGAEADTVQLITGFEASYDYIGNDGPVFYLLTNRDAPNSRVIAVDTANPDPKHWREIIPESKNNLEGASLFGDTFITIYNADVINRVERFGLDGRALGEIPMPVLGSVFGFDGRRTNESTFYYATGITTPGTVYRFDLGANESAVFKQPDVDFQANDFTVRQIFYHSRDGARIPMFIAHRKDTLVKGDAPTFLYAYGGFNVALKPYFSLANILWMELGGVYAMANLRGGGEYGEAWHEAGKKRNKQNVFDDFIAAGEWLISNGVTNSSRLAIGGGSNGGLLVGACINQRPELFGAGIAMVGVFDMLRFHEYTIGWAWTDEFGSPEDPADFETLFAYSPYHNTQAAKPYPPVLITTADHDDRVFPAHSFKFGAALQEAQTGDNPILLRIETRAGHGAGKPTSKSIEEIVDQWSFLTKVFGM